EARRGRCSMTIGRKMTLGFGVPLAFLAFVGAVAALGTARLVATRDRVARAHDVLRAIDAVALDLKDAETGQRGYLLTGKDEYLAPYLAARGDLDRSLQRLRALTSDEPEQRSRLASLEALSGRKLDELGRTIEVRRKEGLDAAPALVATGQGK